MDGLFLSPGDFWYLVLNNVTYWYYTGALVTLVTLIVIYLNHKLTYNVWSKQGIPGPKPVPIFGNMITTLMYNPLIRDPADIETYGKIYGRYLGRIPTLVIADPKLIKKILIKDFNHFTDRNSTSSSNLITKHFLTSVRGEEWKRLRSTMSPTFTSGKMKHMFNLMDSCVDNLKAYLDSKSNQDKLNQDNNVVDVKYTFGTYTMDVIAKCCFATNTNSAAGGAESARFVNHAKVFFTFPRWRLLIAFTLPGFIMRFLQFSVIPRSSIMFFSNVTKSLMGNRRNSESIRSDLKLENGGKSTSKDFLQLMLEAGKKDHNQTVDNNQLIDSNDNNVIDAEAHHGHEDKKFESSEKVLEPKIVSKMSDDEIVANSILFFAAGYETTGSLLTYGTYLLAVNQEVQDKLYDEIKKIKYNISYETVSKLEYLDAVISEALRFYSPVLRLSRVAISDYYLDLDDDEDNKQDDGDKEKDNKRRIFIPKGTGINIPVSAIHKMEEFWNQPEQFNPDRFLPRNRSQIIPYTYLPFGAGPRNCIGMRFALLEAKLALVKILLDFRFFVSSKTEKNLDFSPTMFLLAAESVTLGVEKRHK